MRARSTLGIRRDDWVLRGRPLIPGCWTSLAPIAAGGAARVRYRLVPGIGWPPANRTVCELYFLSESASFTASATPFSAAICLSLALSAPCSDFKAPKYCP